MELKPTDMKYYSEADQKNIKHARKLIILNMLLESGWQKTSNLGSITAECISQASDTSVHVTECTDSINKLIFDGLSTIRGKLVNEAEQVLSCLKIYPSDNSAMSDDERSNHIKQCLRALILHISWPMYSLMGAAILCVIRQALEGRLSKTKNVLQFSTEEFLGVAEGIRKAMMEYAAKPELDEYELMPCMQAHHDKCLRKLRIHTGEMSPTKNTMSYVAAMTTELYQRPCPAPTSTSSSSSLPSSTFDYGHLPVTSWSSSSGTSWYPCEDEHDPVAAKSPLMMLFQYYPPHYSPPEPPYQPHWNANSSGDAVQPDEQQLVTDNPSTFPHVSDQYSFGSLSWGGAPGTGWGGPMA
ncbi:uncharacterized protein EDB91DRAFT_1351041 [Suillus paluster]|uniref:uncharacterized protein n=1 Tax=Suillus paluster TaxID=48578 RepID=UPI001B864486|nr:uncharacterized protein EDB91DRAFT_1351041 [Suillus paluster]KAG1724154.1 hypothetical protein EDB91DRAFT_1351041 [Suillus paluster]